MPEADQAARGYWYSLSDDTAATPASVLDALRRYRTAEHEMRRRTRTSMGMGENDLVAVRYLLAAQRAGRVVTAKDLAQHLDISSASTTALIDRLVRSGHVQRAPHPTDRRAVVVTATPHSDSEVRAAFGRLHEEMLDVVASLEGAELQAVQAFLERIRAVVEDAGPQSATR